MCRYTTGNWAAQLWGIKGGGRDKMIDVNLFRRIGDTALLILCIDPDTGRYGYRHIAH
jgi:hypothetical protein